MKELAAPTDVRSASELPSIDRTITNVSMSEDGWAVEVEDASGSRLTYWVAGMSSPPLPGSTARFFHNLTDRRLCALVIDGQTVFNACQANVSATGAS